MRKAIMNGRYRLWLCALLLLLCVGCAGAPDLERRALAHAGFDREYFIHVPPDGMVSSGEPLPLVLALHGFGETPKGMAAKTGFNDIADREGFLVAYLKGIGRSFDPFNDTKRDEVGYMRAVIEDVAASHAVDRRRIYATGVSNGGFQVYRAACVDDELYAAIAPVIALMPPGAAELCAETRPMPLLAINGDEDPLVRYGGQWVWRNFRVKQPVLSVEETMRLWVHRNGCREAPETEVLPDVDKGDETRVVRTRWGACRNDAEVVLYRIEGGGHIWPGSDDWDFWGLLGEKSRDIEAAEVIWEFFEQHENPYVKEAPAAE